MKLAGWLVALGVALGCAVERGVDRGPAPSKTNEPASSPGAAPGGMAARASVTSALSSFALHSEPFLAWQGNGAPSLRAPVGKPLSFRMSIPGVASWAEANVGWFAVRLYGGTQESIPVDQADSRAFIGYQFPNAGPAVVMLCAGPKVEPSGDAWQRVSHCTKTIVRVGNAGLRPDESSDADITSAAGMPIEVIPLISTLRLKVGSELPARFKFLDRKQAGIGVAALRPDGSLDEKITDGAGVAHFQLSQAGRWIVRFAKAEPDGERVGELVFEIEGGR